MIKSFSKQDLMIAAKRRALEQEMQSDPIARQSRALQDEAIRQESLGEYGQALSLCRKASALFKDSDRSPAAAAAWHNLADMLTNKGAPGVRQYNLLEAEQYYQRALSSPSRAPDVDPYRAFVSRDGLAKCYRAMALLETGFQEQDLLEKAVQLGEEALGIARNAGLEKHIHTASALLSLGNHYLALSQTHRKKTLRCYAEGLSLVEVLERDPHMRLGLAHVAPELKMLLKLQQARAELGSESKVEHLSGRSRMWQLTREPVPQFADAARLELADHLLDDNTESSRTQAQKLLREVVGSSWKHSDRDRLGALLRKAGLLAEARRELSERLAALWEKWHSTGTSELGAHVQNELATTSRLLADVDIDEAQPLDAFLQLENCAALTFYETLRSAPPLTESPSARDLHIARQFVMVLASTCEQLIAGLMHIPEDSHVQGLQAERAALERGRITPAFRLSMESDAQVLLEQGTHQLQRMLEIVTEAEKSPNPLKTLRRHREALEHEIDRLDDYIHTQYPEVEALDKYVSSHIAQPHLEDIFEKWPDTLLLKIDIDTDLLIIAVWSEAGTLVSRAHRQPLAPEMRSALDELQHYRADGKLTLDTAALLAGLAAFDLSAVLPESRPRRVIVLPSVIACWLPLAALGGQGRTLLDLFESVQWLPNLSPLLLPLRPWKPRRGSLLVLPPDTHNPHLAGLHSPSDEVRLEGEAACLETILLQARQAEVVSFFTHHTHGMAEWEAQEEGSSTRPGLLLANGERFAETDALGTFFMGMERVELWACESGLDVPNKLLIPLHEDAFGMDANFLKQGVRTAIGSLWQVPDFVTACLVSHYRKRLIEGVDAAQALADAQRWWRDEAIQTLRASLGQLPFDEALRHFTATLGSNASITSLEQFGRVLGPVAASRPLEGSQLDALMSRFSSPLAWAGFRFLGMPGMTPWLPWHEDLERPLTDQERAEVESVLSWARFPGDKPNPAKPPMPPNVSPGCEDVEEPNLKAPYPEALESWLQEAQSLLTGPSPEPELAIRVARLYRHRLNSSHRHNLLAGLAWLHEALTQPQLPLSTREQLQMEAIWMWLDLAVNEVPHPFQLFLRPCLKGPVIRAQLLLKDLPTCLETEVARQWCQVLDVSARGPNEMQALAEKACTRLLPLLKDWIGARSKRSVFDATPLIWLMDLLRLCPSPTEADLHPWLDASSPLLMPIPAWTDIGIHSRLHAMVWLWHQILGVRSGISYPKEDFLTVREMAALSGWNQRARSVPPELRPRITQILSESFSAIESAYWGHHNDSRKAFWRSTGNPGSAWRTMTASMLMTRALAEGAEGGVPGALAQLQLGADLHLSLMSRMSRLEAWTQPQGKTGTAFALRTREVLLELLFDNAAHSPILQMNEMRNQNAPLFDAFSSQFHHHPLKAFDHDQVSFMLRQWTIPSPETLKRGLPRTSAFQAIRHCEQLTPTLSENGERLSHVGSTHEEMEGNSLDLVRSLSDFGTQIVDLERELDALPPGRGVIGLTFGPLNELIGMVQWNSGEGARGRMLVSREAGIQLTQSLLALLHPHVQDETSRRGSAEARGQSWLELRQSLDSFLRKLLGKRAHHAMSWQVFAPGALRSLPWMGLSVKGIGMFEYAKSVTHLPCFRFRGGLPVPESKSSACLLAPNHRLGDTTFGEAAIKTLRSWQPETVVLDPQQLRGTDVVEVSTLERHERTLGQLRFYALGGIRAVTDATGDLLLAGERAYTQLATGHLRLGKCQRVELWDDSASMGSITRLIRDDADRIPGLANAFFQAGAMAVLDLAWPIHDLVKALICERYTVLSTCCGLPGNEALLRAIREWHHSFRQLHADSRRFTDVVSLLEHLDTERARLATEVGLDTSLLVPMSSLHAAPCLAGQDVDSVIQDICHPVHLAAFRWWGGE